MSLRRVVYSHHGNPRVFPAPVCRSPSSVFLTMPSGIMVGCDFKGERNSPQGLSLASTPQRQRKRRQKWRGEMTRGHLCLCLAVSMDWCLNPISLKDVSGLVRNRNMVRPHAGFGERRFHHSSGIPPSFPVALRSAMHYGSVRRRVFSSSLLQNA